MRDGAGDTGVWLPLWGSSPHPWGAGKAMWLSPLSCGGFRHLEFWYEKALGSLAVCTVQKRVGSVGAWRRWGWPGCPGGPPSFPPPEPNGAQDPASTGQAEGSAGPAPAPGQSQW